VIEQGKLIIDFEMSFGAVSAATRTVNLKAKVGAKLGTYQLRIIAGAQSIDIPTNVVTLEVRASPYPATAVKQEAVTTSQRLRQESAIPKTVTTPPLVKRQTLRLSSAGFNSIVSNVFKGAYFNGNACGGHDSERKTTVNVPNTFFKQEPLTRLQYGLTDGEKDRCKRGNYYRRAKIRACIDQWSTAPWAGSIENGKLKISLSFTNLSILVIKTRAIDEDLDKGLGISWVDSPGDWADLRADENIQDYRLSGYLEVFLAPYGDSNGLSYSGVDVHWSFYEPLTGWVGPGRFICKELEEPKITDYKNSCIEIMRQRILALFSDNQIRARLTGALTQFAKSDSFANRIIAGVSGTGDKIEVVFKE
jgi:hypothetical protein